MAFGTLTALERRTLLSVAHGLTARDIAAREQRSERAIKERYRVIRESLGANSITQALALAVSRGIIHPADLTPDGEG